MPSEVDAATDVSREEAAAERRQRRLEARRGRGKLAWDKDRTRELFRRYKEEGDAEARDQLIESHLKKLTGWIMERWPHVEICVRAIRNDFFGERITVSGLITGGDLIRQLRDEAGCADELLIPVSMLRSGEKVFLDDLTTEDVQRELKIPVRITWTGGEEFLRACLGMEASAASERQVYESWE